MKMIFSINESKPIQPKKQIKINPETLDNKEPALPESFNFFQKTAMFKQILLPYNCGACGK